MLLFLRIKNLCRCVYLYLSEKSRKSHEFYIVAKVKVPKLLILHDEECSRTSIQFYVVYLCSKYMYIPYTYRVF